MTPDGTGEAAERPRAVRIAHEGPKPWEPSIQVDGVDLGAHVVAYRVEHLANEVAPSIVLQLSPRADGVLFEGMAHVAIAEITDDPAEVVKFLENLDPIKVEEAALSRLDLENEAGGTTAAILRQLCDWVRGGA